MTNKDALSSLVEVITKATRRVTENEWTEPELFEAIAQAVRKRFCIHEHFWNTIHNLDTKEVIYDHWTVDCRNACCREKYQHVHGQERETE